MTAYRTEDEEGKERVKKMAQLSYGSSMMMISVSHDI